MAFGSYPKNFETAFLWEHTVDYIFMQQRGKE
jgi:hypothetical protein